jgi:CRISPR-associated Csx14 family protein
LFLKPVAHLKNRVFNYISPMGGFAMSRNQNQTGTVLIATLGTEPQVVTAALDLLQQKGEGVSRAVVVHTTAPGTLIEVAVNKLREEFAHSQLPMQWMAMRDENGLLLQDVETPQAARSAFRALYGEVRRAKLNGEKVHLLIAGGRKTQAVYGMLAAQLLFDDDDCLWHLFSGGDFLASKRMHPQAGDEVHLVPIPVVLWWRVSPVMLDLIQYEDPFDALERQKALRLAERMEEARGFVRGALTPAEERVVALLVREGQSDQEMAEKLSLSPRTVEQHLRSAYLKAANHWMLEDVKRAQLVALLSLFYSVQMG